MFEKADQVKKVVFFHMRNLLLTYPGEKISDPQYGIGIKLFLFENITTGLLNNIADRIENEINKYLPYIDLKKVEVSSPLDSNALKVKIAFEIPDLDISEIFNFTAINT